MEDGILLQIFCFFDFVAKKSRDRIKGIQIITCGECQLFYLTSAPESGLPLVALRSFAT